MAWMLKYLGVKCTDVCNLLWIHQKIRWTDGWIEEGQINDKANIAKCSQYHQSGRYMSVHCAVLSILLYPWKFNKMGRGGGTAGRVKLKIYLPCSLIWFQIPSPPLPSNSALRQVWFINVLSILASSKQNGQEQCHCEIKLYKTLDPPTNK